MEIEMLFPKKLQLQILHRPWWSVHRDREATLALPWRLAVNAVGALGGREQLWVLKTAEIRTSPIAQNMSLSTVGRTLSNWTEIDWKKRSCLSR